MIFAKTILFTAAMAMTAASVTASPIINRRDPQATDTIISEVDASVGVDASLDDISVGVDASLDDMPAAQAILGPTVTRSGNNYTWEFTNLNVRDTGPFGITADSWGTRLPNVNRVWTSDPLDPKNFVMRINYPNGTTTPSAASNPPNVVGGVGFYAQPISPGILKTANLVEFEYSVYFPPGYNFVRGGKLPGLYGGDGTKKGCSGGNDGDSCFSLRYMWRKLGAGETYIYRPKSAIMDSSYCKIRPYSFCDADYGDSIGRGSFTFTPGKWTKLRQQIGLNKPGTQTGTMKVWADDKLVIDYSKMVWRTSPNVTVQGIVFQSFFGGSTADWATPVDQYTLFKGFKMSAFC